MRREVRVSVTRLHSLTVGGAGDAPLPPAVAEPLADLVGEEDGAGDSNEADEVKGAEGLGLEDILEPGKIDDEKLAGDGEGDGPVKKAVGQKPDLTTQE